jgi:hypothetical protein
VLGGSYQILRQRVLRRGPQPLRHHGPLRHRRLLLRQHGPHRAVSQFLLVLRCSRRAIGHQEVQSRFSSRVPRIQTNQRPRNHDEARTPVPPRQPDRRADLPGESRPRVQYRGRETLDGGYAMEGASGVYESGLEAVEE